MSVGIMDFLYSGAIHVREQGKIEAARIRTARNNKLAASNAQFATWMQSYSNQRALKYAGEDITAVNENLSRELDNATYGRAMSRLAASEEIGANLASAAAAGVGGNTVDMFQRTLGLTQAMQEETQDRAIATGQYAMATAKNDILNGAVTGMGNQTFAANLDYTTFIDHKKMSTTQMLVTTALAGVATYFGGPQAGAAVFDVSAARHRATNGDIDGSAALMASGFERGLGAFAQYERSGRTPWGETMRARFQDRAAAGANLQIGGTTARRGALNFNPFNFGARNG